MASKTIKSIAPTKEFHPAVGRKYLVHFTDGTAYLIYWEFLAGEFGGDWEEEGVVGRSFEDDDDIPGDEVLIRDGKAYLPVA